MNGHHRIPFFRRHFTKTAVSQYTGIVYQHIDTAIGLHRLFKESRNLGTISGLVTMTHHIAGGLGALVGAALFDADGNYEAAFILMLALSIMATGITYVFAKRNR